MALVREDAEVQQQCSSSEKKVLILANWHAKDRISIETNRVIAIKGFFLIIIIIIHVPLSTPIRAKVTRSVFLTLTSLS